MRANAAPRLPLEPGAPAMFSPIRSIHPIVPAMVATIALFAPARAASQSSGLNIELHANENVSAHDMGLPAYPGARPFQDAKSDSSVDMGFAFGSFHFRLMASKYVTNDAADRVLDFYRKPLSRYGDVLECEHGLAVGAVKVARSGLTCEDSHDEHAHLNATERSTRELRSGTPTFFRIVAIDSARTDATHFILLLLDVPEDRKADR